MPKKDKKKVTVGSSEAMSKSSEEKYKEAQKKRVEIAKGALSGISEASGLLAAPTRQNALSFVKSIAGKDLTGAVGSKLPAKSDYK